MRGLERQSFGERYGIDQSDLIVWLDQSDVRSTGDAQYWYDMSGTVNQFSQSSSSFRPDLLGKVALAGAARYFDGDDRMTLADNSTFDNSGEITLGMWFTTTSGATSQSAYRMQASGSGALWSLRIVSGKARSTFRASSGNHANADSASTYNDGNWHHMAATLNSNNIILYVDGAQVGSATVSTSGNYNPTGVQALGYLDYVADEFFTGYQSSFFISKRTLSAAEVQRMYLADKPRYGGL